MTHNKGRQLNAGQLKKLIEFIPDDTKLYFGFGENVKPLRYLCVHNDGLMFHPDIYGVDSEPNNWQTVEFLFKEQP